MASTKVYKVTGFDTVIFNGVELNQIPPTLEECRWDQIQALVKSGLIGEYFSVGDTKSFKMSTGETITMQIVAINDGSGASGQYYPANTIDLVSINTTTNNSNMCKWVGTEEPASTCWTSSSARSKLNNTIINNIPDSVRNIIIPKEHEYIELNLATNYIYKRISRDYLWLPTVSEISGSVWNGEDLAHNKHYSMSDGYGYTNKRCTSSLLKSNVYVEPTGYENMIYNVGHSSFGSSFSRISNSNDLPVYIGFRIG